MKPAPDEYGQCIGCDQDELFAGADEARIVAAIGVMAARVVIVEDGAGGKYAVNHYRDDAPLRVAQQFINLRAYR